MSASKRGCADCRNIYAGSWDNFQERNFQEEKLMTDAGLSLEARDALLAQINEDGYAVLPELLPNDLIRDCLAAIDRIARAERAANPGLTGVKCNNCVDDAAFRHLMMYQPALEMAHDCFGPLFHLCQSNLISRPRDEARKVNFVDASPWHADGPRPRLFPRVPSTHGLAMGLHYLKFGYFLTDLTHGNGGSLQVIRGSHRRDELDGKGAAFRIEDYADDLIQFDCPAGTVVAFHQAQWHAAPPNESDVERKNVYISYCPTWMRPIDRDFPTAEQLYGLSDEEKFLMGEPRPPLRWWLGGEGDNQRLDKYRRPVDEK
jgi:ectoine hydroxylase